MFWNCSAFLPISICQSLNSSVLTFLPHNKNNISHHLLSTYYVAGIILNFSHVLAHLILTKANMFGIINPILQMWKPRDKLNNVPQVTQLLVNSWAFAPAITYAYNIYFSISAHHYPTYFQGLVQKPISSVMFFRHFHRCSHAQENKLSPLLPSSSTLTFL